MPAPSRIDATFDACRARGEAALVTYVMAGDPDVATSRAMALACAEGGADLLEIGMPFSDPIADGPTIQLASERALAKGTTVANCLEIAAWVRARTPVPIALMGYLNPVLSYGEERFVEDCGRAGVDAVIIPDLPPEEAEDFRALARRRGLATVFLLAPTSTPARRKAACDAASGFLYFVSVTGVTGARRELSEELPRQLAAVRAESPVPVVVGFGVSTPEQARSLAPLADGVVVGSAIVSRIAEGGPRAARAQRVRRFVSSLKRGLRR
ncbi:MAG TPA: tryptophan synthase subunit alpha [Anaeromyxobacteraceae bacterium]|nr:tryptophan synthase subunit alpha [Anaeromyxobacteraceae bacterium]